MFKVGDFVAFKYKNELRYSKILKIYIKNGIEYADFKQTCCRNISIPLDKLFLTVQEAKES